MHQPFYAKLRALARRHTRDGGAVDDLVQEALIAALVAGQTDFQSPETLRWLAGTLRNRARMATRGAVRSRGRDARWQAAADPVAPETIQADVADLLSGLSPALRTLAALVLSGHSRREIAHLLDLRDAALRQRISALRRHMRTRGLVVPAEMSGLSLDLAYGRIRAMLQSALARHGGHLASHDPDGHLFIVARSQNQDRRQ